MYVDVQNMLICENVVILKCVIIEIAKLCLLKAVLGVCCKQACIFANACCVPTLLVSWVSIIKLWTCLSARDSSSLRFTTATSNAVHPAPCKVH